MLNPEYVTIEADGLVYTGFESVSVSASIKEAARTFKIDTTERPGQFKFPPGTHIAIRANGDLMCDGYVNRFEPKGDAEKHGITISGRSKSQDAIDSSADTPTGEWNDADPDQVARDLFTPYGVGVRAKVPLDKVERWAIAPGERAHENVTRMLRPQGVTTMGNADGSVDLTNAKAATFAYGILMEGWNIKTYSGCLSDEGRFSQYTVRGQRRLGSTDNDLHVEEHARDSGGNRNRRRIIINETDTDPKRARKRADHEKRRAAGESVSCSIGTQGFRDMSGKLFAPNSLIYVHSPVLLHISQTMLIQSLVWKQEAKKGSTTDLKLVDPRAHGGEKGKGGGMSPDGGALDSETDGAWTEGY